MSTIAERVARLFRRAQPPRQTSAVGLESADAVGLSALCGEGASESRFEMYDDADRLDAECPEAAAALDAIASLVSAAAEGEDVPFRIEWETGAPPAARSALGDLVRRARLGPKSFAIARDAARYGDNFLEVVLDEAMQVVRLKHLPVRQLFREEGAHGELLDPAFTQRPYPGAAPLVTFHAWQIVHLRWGHEGERRYGRSHLSVARTVWKRLRPLEESMRVARLERGYDKLVHYVEIPPEAGREDAQRRLDDYRRRMGSRLVYNPDSGAYELRRQGMNVRTDFYVPVSRGESGGVTGGDVKLLAADNAQLAHIADVDYLHRQLLCALRVPAAFLGFEKDVNARATLSEQYAEFARAIRRAQGTLSAAYRQVFDLQLQLLGYDPAALGYRIVWPEVRVEEAQARAEAELLRARAER
ncbi:MAG: portal protein [Armatimonadetes bacterium]|nr:portal protein [Armatimonadota bacterium]